MDISYKNRIQARHAARLARFGTVDGMVILSLRQGAGQPRAGVNDGPVERQTEVMVPACGASLIIKGYVVTLQYSGRGKALCLRLFFLISMDNTDQP